MPRERTRIHVDPKLRDRFLARFPGTGSLAWILETAIIEVLDLTAGSPDATSVVRAAIRAAVLRERQHRKTLEQSTRVQSELAAASVEPID